ncbi:MAG: chromophore lyase CpcT/CpeT [Saprospiraceae bacterium]
MKKYFLFLFTILIFIIGCSPQKSMVKNNALKELQNMMTGSFDSHLQSEKDTTYFDISLEMYPIWQGSGEYYLYVEQAVSSMKEKPYRQRIYKLEELSKGKFVSKVYTLNDPKSFIGKYNDAKFFEKFDVSILKEREGCGVFLTKKGSDYEGSTDAKKCGSTMRGASYATSIVTIKKDRIESWDQGFDAKNEQVWGATEGGYIFLRK